MEHKMLVYIVYMKEIATLIVDIAPIETKGDLSAPISSVSIDSRYVQLDTLFVAIAGAQVDGHDFINDAITRGAKAVIYEKDLTEYKNGITYIKVADTHRASGFIASTFYDNPSKKLKLVGITGTNGKTTVATLLHQLFMNLGYKAGMIGTVVNKINYDLMEAVRTTPDTITLNATLAQMVGAGCEYCFMEVSSHAISLHRIMGLEFAGGVFTNLTHDHLDFHNTLDEYANTKKEFFTNLPEESFALSNLDSDYGEFMLEHTKANKYFYSRDKLADFSGRIETKLIGDFNQSNVLAVIGTVVLLGIDKKVAIDKIKYLDPAPGRFVSIKSAKGITGIIDYAHTPDALENVLKEINKLKGDNKLISIIGCGGDRDKAKRPVMAKIGYDLSDILILTSDNPRTEKIEDIINDMCAGLPNDFEKKTQIIPDRHDAITCACEIAKSGDYILLAGKGHENYQEVNGIKTHFDDTEELKKCFNK